MSRRRAREITFHMIFENETSGISAFELIERDLKSGYCDSLADESAVYSKPVDDIQLEYVKKAVDGVISKREELEAFISKYSVGWDVSRISRVSRSLLKLSMYEVKYMGIPVGASVNEALELVKKYDNDEAVPFVNGVLASFIKNEIKHE